LLVCRGANKHIRASVNAARDFFEEMPFTNPDQTTAYDSLYVQSFFYYDVFLSTNQWAISFALTAFFICTPCPPILGALMSRCPYDLSHPVSHLYSFRKVKVRKFAGTPFVLRQPIVILGIHNSKFALRQRYEPVIFYALRKRAVASVLRSITKDKKEESFIFHHQSPSVEHSPISNQDI
jgi:hypothetical protein